MTDTVQTTAASRALTRQESSLIWLLLAAAFVAILNETTMSVALPHLMKDLGITAVQAQWLTTAFMLTMAVVIPTTGFLLQRFTTRAVFLTAISLFSVGTAVAAVAPGFEVLLAARVVQASGTAIMMPLLMTTVMTLVPAESRGRFMGRISIVMSLAPAIGPSMAGLVLQSLSWHWIFGIVLPIALIALVAGWRWMTNTGEPGHAPLDILSVILSAFAFGGIVFGLSQLGSAESTGGSATAMIIALTVGVISLALFVWRQLVLQQRDDALLDLRVFLSRNFTITMIQMTVLSAAFFGALTVLPLYLQNVLELKPFEAALVLLPGALAMGLLGPLIGRIYDAKGPRVLLIPGSIIAAAVLWFYTTVTETTSPVVIGAAQTLICIGLAMSFTPLFTASLGSLTPKLYSHGSAVVGTVQQVAGAAGIALLVTVMSAVTAASAGEGRTAAGAAGTRSAFLIAAVLSLVPIVLSFFVRKPDDSPEGIPGH
ncbi:MDR family MFS transporter [Microbacterium gorillae]|uniref:MDR family MFS transporter n=1 Tax=Microbacterium gorillae TaxID=1231063 RepID=UPI00058AEE82|nr:MDR family MFS transporter [Microbacterium gorillae]